MNRLERELGADHIVVGDGQLGWALADTLRERGEEVQILTRRELDLRETGAIPELVEQLAAETEAVFLTAAVTDVDGCEVHRERAFTVNSAAPAVFARELDERGIPLVFYSSDYVFGDSFDSPIPPDAPREPLNVYGMSKLSAELAVGNLHRDSLIVRSSGLFGGGESFVEEIAVRLAEGEPVRVVDDQISRLCSADYLAQASLELLDDGARGVWHVALRGAGSWFEHTGKIAAALGIDDDRVKAISSVELDRKARRPNYSVLDTEKTERRIGEAPELERVLGNHLKTYRQKIEGGQRV